MSVTKEDLLQLANDLVLAGTEVQWRAGASRAYYAAYHGSLVWHGGMPTPGSVGGQSGGVHQQLLNQLRNGAPEWPAAEKSLGRILSAQLGALKTRRTIADYDLNEPFDQALAQTDCAMAGHLISKL